MENAKSFDKSQILRVMIQDIEKKRNPMEIKTDHLKNYSSPEKLTLKGTEEIHKPDMVVVYDKETHLYEVELDRKMETEKWKLYSLYARKNHGNFYLIVPDWLRDPVKDRLKEENINAGLIYFNTN
jgi:hypothetical protein